jgi:AcrR family transcriptional regulator
MVNYFLTIHYSRVSLAAMNLELATLSSDQVAEAILAAALQRFDRYGYNKTTMAEIAADCTMSAANIYRYFHNKLDIAARLAVRCLAEEEQALAAILARADQPASERLRTLLSETLRYTHRLWSEHPRLNELVQAITDERLDVVKQHQSVKLAQLVQLLREGNSCAEFNVADPEHTARAILCATTMFDVPFFMHLHTQSEFEGMLEGVLQLMLQGILKRQGITHDAGRDARETGEQER